jgi:hypothetical protein
MHTYFVIQSTRCRSTSYCFGYIVFWTNWPVLWSVTWFLFIFWPLNDVVFALLFCSTILYTLRSTFWLWIYTLLPKSLSLHSKPLRNLLPISRIKNVAATTCLPHMLFFLINNERKIFFFGRSPGKRIPTWICINLLRSKWLQRSKITSF